MADVISFSRGAPSLDIVDIEGLGEAAQRAFANDPAGATAYGGPLGYGPLREWIAEQHGVDLGQVLVTNGSMMGDALLFDTLVDRGSTVVVERPTYDRTLRSLVGRGAELRAIDLEDDGLDVGALEAELVKGLSPALAHVIPNFQNPAGCSLSTAKRGRLAGLAEEHDFVVFEDDPYAALRFAGEAPPTLLSLDDHDRVVYASSFSKTVCPGIRIGYLVGPTALIQRVKALIPDLYISPNMVAGAIVNEFCRSGAIDRSIETVKAALAERSGALGAALEREIPEGRFVAPEGGYFLWVDLPDRVDVDALHAAAAERGVAFEKGSAFMLEGGGSSLRLAYSSVTVAQAQEGVARLADALRAVDRDAA